MSAPIDARTDLSATISSRGSDYGHDLASGLPPFERRRATGLRGLCFATGLPRGTIGDSEVKGRLRPSASAVNSYSRVLIPSLGASCSSVRNVHLVLNFEEDKSIPSRLLLCGSLIYPVGASRRPRHLPRRQSIRWRNPTRRV